MYCGKCGKEIKDNAKFCPYCGAPVTHKPAARPEDTAQIEDTVLSDDAVRSADNKERRSFENSAGEEEKAPSRKKKKSGLVIAVCGLIAAALVLFFVNQNIIAPSNRYKEAIAYYENGEYDQAIPVLEELGDFRDSKDMLNTVRYQKGLALLSENSYEKAMRVFEELGTYENSETLYADAKYGYGKDLLESGDYDKAIDAFFSLEGYKDSDEMKRLAMYWKARTLRDEKKYDEAISLFSELADYEDSQEQLLITEKEKTENTVRIPDLTGLSLDKAETALENLGLTYSVEEKEIEDHKVGTVLSSDPAPESVVFKGSDVVLVVVKGSSAYSNYLGDGNSKVLFQVNITSTGNNLRVRSAPTAVDDNKLANAHAGDVYNVFEILQNEGYDWYRIGDRKWIAYDSAWVVRDAICDRNDGSFEFYTAKIIAEDHISIYDRPVENENQRNWVSSVYENQTVRVYYTFNNGSHVWYKIGPDQWVKDFGGDRVSRQ